MDKLKFISWILRGSQRRAIFIILNNRIMIPAQIFQEVKLLNSKITRNNVSDILKELKEKKLAICLNPNEKKGRLYQLTKLGKTILNEIKNN